MSDESGSPGHLSADDIEVYFRAGLTAHRKVAESPVCILVVEPAADRLSLRTPATDSPPDVDVFERITFDVVQDTGLDDVWFELSIDATGNRYEAYLVLASVVDLLVGGVSFRVAVADSLQAFKDILARRQRLTEEQQVGLAGELLLLEHSLAAIGLDDGLEAWLGAAGEEHDFVFPAFDVEVKSTRGEARVHMINSATQLEPAPGRPLYLLSIQLTAAGAADQGATLGDIVGRVRQLLGSRHQRVFDDKIGGAGWHDDDHGLYPKRWVYRSRPQAYLVDDEFPAITTGRIAASVPQPEVVVGVQYRLDVTQLPADDAPYPIDRFCQEG